MRIGPRRGNPRTPLSFWESGAWVEGAVERRQPKNRAAFFSPDDGRRVSRGWLVPQGECRRWFRHRRSRRDVRWVVPGKSASQPTYGSAVLSHSARKIGYRLNQRFHLRASFPGWVSFRRPVVLASGPRNDTNQERRSSDDASKHVAQSGGRSSWWLERARRFHK